MEKPKTAKVCTSCWSIAYDRSLKDVVNGSFKKGQVVPAGHYNAGKLDEQNYVLEPTFLSAECVHEATGDAELAKSFLDAGFVQNRCFSYRKK